MKKIERKTDFCVGLIFLTLGIFILAETLTFKQTLITDNYLGASFFPRIVSVVLILLSLNLMGSSVVLKIDSSVDEGAAISSFRFHRLKRPLAVILLLVLYYLLIQVIGFCLTSTFLFWGILFVIQAEKKKFYAIAPVFVGCVYFVFRYLFLVQLPTGMVGF